MINLKELGYLELKEIILKGEDSALVGEACSEYERRQAAMLLDTLGLRNHLYKK